MSDPLDRLRDVLATRQIQLHAEEVPEERDVLGYLGALAARRGDTREAERVSE